MKCFKFALYSTQRLHFLQFTFFVIIKGDCVLFL